MVFALWQENVLGLLFFPPVVRVVLVCDHACFPLSGLVAYSNSALSVVRIGKHHTALIQPSPPDLMDRPFGTVQGLRGPRCGVAALRCVVLPRRRSASV